MKKTACKNGIWLKANTDFMGSSQIWFSPPCGLKSCPTCAKKRQVSIVIRVLSAVHSHPELNWYFATITIWGSWHKKPYDVSRKKMQHSWSKLRKRLSRDFSDFFWCKVWERHKDGTPHLHVIFGSDKPITEHDLTSDAVGTGFGYQCDLKTVTSKRAWYIAKYATKASEQGRQIEWSRNFPLAVNPPENDNGLEWEYMGKVDINHVIDYLERIGVRYEILNDVSESE